MHHAYRKRTKKTLEKSGRRFRDLLHWGESKRKHSRARRAEVWNRGDRSERCSWREGDKSANLPAATDAEAASAEAAPA